MKTCTLCKAEKSFGEFSKRKDQKDGLHFWCKPCLKVKKAESYQKNREKALATMAEYRKANPEKVAAAKKAAYEKKPDQYAAKARAKYASNPEFYKAKSKTWYELNRDRARQRGIIYRSLNKDREKSRAAAYRERNRSAINEKTLQRQRDNRESYNAYQLKYRMARYKTDPLYAMQMICRRRILCAMQKGGYKKSTKTEALLGCSFPEFKAHLESKFLPGMTWENRGVDGWHIDHVVPLSSAKDQEEMERLCHHTNMQPLWAKDNHAKGAKMPHEWEASDYG